MATTILSENTILQKAKTKVIAGPGSVLLDSLRIIAALTVLVSHAHNQWFPSANQATAAEAGELAHAAVVIFFVLSGFVIAYTTTSRNRGPEQYAVARFSRLCSVVLPALVITAIIKFALSKIDPELDAFYTRKPEWIRYLLAGTFLNESWFMSAAPPINGPLWSLSFEFWYYAIFGAWVFRGKSIMGILIFLLACAIAGPKILLMMPIWLTGCVSFWLPTPKLKSSIAWTIVFSSLVTAVLAMVYLPAFPTTIGAAPLCFANQFATDWVVGLFIGLALWVLPLNANSTAQPKWMDGWFRKLADLTFPIYVLHNPLLIFFRGLFNFKEKDATQLGIAIICVFLVSVVIGLFLESQRPAWVRFFKWFFSSGRRFLGKFIPALQTSSRQA